MAYPYLIQGKNIVVVIGNKSHTVGASHIGYERIKTAIKDGDWDTVADIIEPKKIVLSYGAGNIAIQGDKLFWKGDELHTSLAVRLIQMFQEGFPIDPMVAFMENLMTNPSELLTNYTNSWKRATCLSPRMAVSWLTRRFVRTTRTCIPVLFSTRRLTC